MTMMDDDRDGLLPPMLDDLPGPGGAAPVATVAPEPSRRTLGDACAAIDRLRARMRAAVRGRDEVVDLILIALLADGHVLLEDYPGSGKTTLAKALGASIVDDRPAAGEGFGERPEREEIAPFRRIQFTPDLLPSDVTGTSVFDAVANRFHFRHGPLFAHVVLADEINRTSPKVQAAMLEAMAEKQVTVDNVTYRLDDLFFVIATQNPLDLAGTYPLPTAQLDRFLFKIRMEHIDRDAELDVVRTWQSRRDTLREDLPRVTRGEIFAARRILDQEVHVSPAVQECLVDVARAIRADARVLQGTSTRSLVLALPALQARAGMRGRDYVASDDIEALAGRIFGHRVELAPGAGSPEEVVRDAARGPLERLARATLSRRR